MSKMGTPTSRRGGNLLMQKMLELNSAYKEISDKDRELVKYKMSNNSRTDQYDHDDEKDREIVRLKYMVGKLDERLQVAKVESENAKRELKNEQEGRKIVDKKLKALDKDNKEMRNKMSGLRAKLGVVNANHNVIKHETDELRKTNQENQIQIARLEERLAAANQERERIKNPMNPDGSEEVRRKLVTENKEIKKLKAQLLKMENHVEFEQKKLDNKEEENRMLATELNICRETIGNLETSLEMAEMTIEAEKASREDFENQNRKLRSERAGYDEQIKQFKVKLGISNASKNVNIRHAEVLRKKDEEYQNAMQTLEKKLKMANAEIERLKTRYEMSGKTADSLQEHKGRLKRYRKAFGTEYQTIEQLDKPGVTGWTPNRNTPQDRISMNSVGSLTSRKYVHTKSTTNSGKGGRTSVP